MAIRFLLVGVVAALGIDLPTDFDGGAWTDAGNAWWNARVAEFEARYGDAKADDEGTASPAPVVAVVTAAPDDDAAFATVVEEMVEAFAVDASSDLSVPSDVTPRLVAGPGDPSFGIACVDALNRWADGLSEPAEPAASAAEAGVLALHDGPDGTEAERSAAAASEESVESFAFVADEAPAMAGAPEVVEPSPARFTDAVEQTGRAFEAWLTLLGQTGPVVSSTR